MIRPPDATLRALRALVEEALAEAPRQLWKKEPQKKAPSWSRPAAEPDEEGEEESSRGASQSWGEIMSAEHAQALPKLLDDGELAQALRRARSARDLEARYSEPGAYQRLCAAVEAAVLPLLPAPPEDEAPRPKAPELSGPQKVKAQINASIQERRGRRLAASKARAERARGATPATPDAEEAPAALPPAPQAEPPAPPVERQAALMERAARRRCRRFEVERQALELGLLEIRDILALPIELPEADWLPPFPAGPLSPLQRRKSVPEVQAEISAEVREMRSTPAGGFREALRREVQRYAESFFARVKSVAKNSFPELPTEEK